MVYMASYYVNYDTLWAIYPAVTLINPIKSQLQLESGWTMA